MAVHLTNPDFVEQFAELRPVFIQPALKGPNGHPKAVGNRSDRCTARWQQDLDGLLDLLHYRSLTRIDDRVDKVARMLGQRRIGSRVGQFEIGSVQEDSFELCLE